MLNLNKIFKKSITILIVVFLAVPSIQPHNVLANSSMSLSAPLINGDINDNAREKKVQIASYLLCEYMKDSNVICKVEPMGFNSKIGSVKLLLPAINYKFKEYNNLEISIVECLVNNESFFAYLTRSKEGNLNCYVADKDEFEQDKKLLEGKQSIMPLLKPFVSRLEYSISVMDDGVQLSLEFLKELQIEKAVNFLQSIVEKHELFIKDLMIFSGSGKGAVVLCQSGAREDRAWGLIEKIFIDNNCEQPLIVEVKEIFFAYLRNRQGINCNDFGDLKVMLDKKFSNQRQNASNEGDFHFPSQAYSSLPKLSDIPRENCKQIFARIKTIFWKVLMHEMMEYNQNVPPEKRMDKSDLPIKMEKIVMENISEGLLPTVIVEKNGTIKINENFVKLMYEFDRQGLSGPNGDIFTYNAQKNEQDKTLPKLGNLFESIIYSVALHEIRGHFPVNKYGFFAFNPDEQYAQQQRGHKHYYINTLAMLYFWFIIVGKQGRELFDDAESFIDKNKEIFSKLSPRERKVIVRHVWTMVSLFDSRILENDDKSDNSEEKETWDYYKKIMEKTSYYDAKKWKDNNYTYATWSSRKDFKRSIYPESVFYRIKDVSKCGKKIFSELEVARKPFLADVKAWLDLFLDLKIIESAVPPKDHADIKENTRFFKLTPETVWDRDKVISNCDIVPGEKIEDIRERYILECEKIWAERITHQLKDYEAQAPPEKIDESNFCMLLPPEPGVEDFLARTALPKPVIPKPVKISNQGREIVIAMSKDWIPESDRMFTQSQLRSIYRLNDIGNNKITFIYASKEDLASRVKEALDGMKDKLKDVIILGGNNCLKNPTFNDVRSNYNDDKTRLLFIEINSNNFKNVLSKGKANYIRLMEIIAFSFSVINGDRAPESWFGNFKVEPKNNAYIILTLKSEPMDIEMIKKIYSAQEKILYNA